MGTKKRAAVLAWVGLLGAASVALGGPVFSMSDGVASAAQPGPVGTFSTAGSGYFDFLSDLSTIGFITASATNQNAAPPGDTITIGTIAYAPTNLNTSTVTTFALPFDYRVTLTDTASAASGTFDLTGLLTGSETASPTQITTSFQDLALSTSTLNLGGNVYTISGGSFAGPTGNSNGVIQLTVTAPEPTGLGLLGCGAVVLRRRRLARG